MREWHLLSRSPHQVCLSSGSNGQNKQDLASALHANSSSTSLLSPRSSVVAVKHGPYLLSLKRKIQAFETKCRRKLLLSPTWSTGPRTGCGARSTSLWVHRNLFWQLPRDGNLHGSGMSHDTTASPKPFFRAHWRVGDAMVSREDTAWTTSKS